MNKDGKLLLAGASGSIGRSIALRLLNDGYSLLLHVRSLRKAEAIRDMLEREGVTDNFSFVTFDIRDSVESINESIKNISDSLSSALYFIGNCPPAGFDDAVATPMSQLAVKTFQDDLDIHPIGLMKFYQATLPLMTKEGSYVIGSSAITRFTPQTMPPWVNVFGHIAVIAAEHKIVDGMRHELLQANNRNIKVHHIMPGGVDTDFHRGCVHQAPAYVSINQVVDAVIAAIDSNSNVDTQLVPMPPQTVTA